MRAFIVTAVAILTAGSAFTGAATAQEQTRLNPDSIRALDTEPSIPLQRPTLGPGSAGARSDQIGTPSPDAADPGAPVSSHPGAGDPVMGGAAVTVETDTSLPGAQPGTYPLAGGLPERAAPPRTLRAHWHVFVAFAIVWALLFGYALSIGRRFGRLEDEVRRLGDSTG